MVNLKQNKGSGLYESAKISGFADVWNGEWKLKHGKNHLLTNGLKAIAIIYGVNQNSWCGMFYNTNNVMQVGTNTTVPTSFSMSALVSPLASSSSITYPNTVSVSAAPTNPSGTTYYQTTVQAIWNAGTLGSNTLGEFGLFAAYNGSTYLAPVHNVLLTRIASADGTFSSFSINPNFPLVIDYVVQASYV